MYRPRAPSCRGNDVRPSWSTLLTDEEGPYRNNLAQTDSRYRPDQRTLLGPQRFEVMTWATVVFVSKHGTWIVAQEYDEWIVLELVDDEGSEWR
jgi:hypothetical protein